MNRSRKLKIFLVGTEFYRHAGGIQQVNRSLMQALTSERLEIPMELQAFSYLDRAEDLPSPAPAAANFFGHGGWRSALVARFSHAVLRFQPDLVLFTHVHLLPLMLACRLLSPRTKIAVLCHGVEVWEPLPMVLRRGLQAADAVVCPSEFTKSRVASLQGIPRERIHVIPHGLPPDWKSLGSSPVSSSCSEPMLLSVARMSRDDARYGRKGIEDVLQALPAVLGRCPQARYVVVGDGDDRSRLQLLAQQLGVSHAVEFRGPLCDDARDRAYAEASIFVLPTTIEGFGLVFLEAMAHGLPVVASRAGAAPEVVLDQQTGMLVPDSAPDTLAAAISSLLGDSMRRQEMSIAAQRRVEVNFLFEHFCARWRNWLVALLPRQTYLARHTLYFPPAVAESILKKNRFAA